MNKKKVLVLLLFFFFLASTFLLTLNNMVIFRPSYEYKIFAYLTAFILSFSLVYLLWFSDPTINQKTKVFTPFIFLLFMHFYLVGMFSGFPQIYFYFSYPYFNQTHSILSKHHRTNRYGKSFYILNIEDSSYYGELYIDKKTFESVELYYNRYITLSGRKNTFGFYAAFYMYNSDFKDKIKIPSNNSIDGKMIIDVNTSKSNMIYSIYPY